MDKRYKPMTAIEQMNKRLQVLENINNNPEWQIYQIASYIRKGWCIKKYAKKKQVEF